MKIIKSMGEFTKGEMFNITQGSTAKVSDQIGEVLEFDGWLMYEDEDQNGKTQTVLAFRGTDGLISATISTTFIKQFNKIIEHMGDDEYNIKVVGGTSKNGRQYITCEVA